MQWKKTMTTVSKFLLSFLLIIILIFIIAFFMMQFGVETGDIQHFLANTWLIWLFIRFSIYIIGGVLLYKSLKLARNEQEKLAYKKLMRAFVIWLMLIEGIIFVQLRS